MLVCHCRRICQREVLHAARSGARTVESVGELCGAGTACGGCQPLIEEILDEHHGEAAPCSRRALLPMAPLIAC